MTTRERRLAGLLGALILLGAVLFGARQIFGRGIGAPCTDSYNCRGLGSECVEVDGLRYCTLYCGVDRDCPTGWHCLEGNPTVLTIETDSTGRVCVRD